MRGLFKTLPDCWTGAPTVVPGLCPQFPATLADAGFRSRFPTHPRILSMLQVSCFSRGAGTVRVTLTLGLLGGSFAEADLRSWTWIVFRRTVQGFVVYFRGQDDRQGARFPLSPSEVLQSPSTPPRLSKSLSPSLFCLSLDDQT